MPDLQFGVAGNSNTEIMSFSRVRKVWIFLPLAALGFTFVALFTDLSVLQRAANSWIVSDPINAPADAIIVLAGGYNRRPLAAVELYKRGLGREIWITGESAERSPSENGNASPGSAELSRALLLKLGIPSAAIVDVPGQVTTTYEEAALVLNRSRVSGAKSLIVPTDAFHTFRVKWVFDKLVGDAGISIVVRPIFSNNNAPNHWWQSAAGRTEFAGEIIKYLYYRLKY